MTVKKVEIFPIIVPIKMALQSFNFFLVKIENSLVLVDAGMNTEDCWQGLSNSLKTSRFTLEDITHIVLTHHHGDHVGLVNRIVEQHPIPVYAHHLSVPRLKRDPDHLERRIEFFTNLYEEMGCGEAGDKQVQHLKKAVKNNATEALHCDIHDLSELAFPTIEIIETPGHAIDQVAFYEKGQKWLLSGDLLIQHISSNALVEPDEQGNRMKTVVEHERSLQKIQAYDVEKAFPGHGEIITNPHELITKRIHGIERKAEKFHALLNAKALTASELAQLYYKETYNKQFSLVMSEVIGHLDYLEEKGKVTKDFSHGVWKYSARQ